ncbi:MAG: hypothetical protein J6B90_05225 [Lachnospiraceae bacterium]|nr:hypothetical protein [Lachnospiraceae bacterium]
MKTNHIIGKFKNTKDKTFEVLITAVLMATGINFTVSGITLSVDSEFAKVFIVIGVLIVSVTFALLLAKLIKRLNKKEYIEGFFLYHDKSHEILEIPEYKISEDMNSCLKSAFVENKAIEKHWTETNVRKFEPVGVAEDKRIVAKASQSMLLLVELIEYCILERLSTTICDYFNSIEHKTGKKSKVKTYLREDIPDILLSNRFLKLFSEPMDNREGFLNSNSDNVVSAFGKKGVRYSRFDLVLPQKTIIKRENKNTIVVNMKSFTLKITVLFGGFNTYIDREFYRYYLGCEKSGDICPYQFNVDIEVKFKLRSLLHFNDWKHYEWIDVFIDTMYKYLDQDTFFDGIGWEVNKVLLRCIENKKLL